MSSSGQLTAHLIRLAAASRTRDSATDYDAFVSYSHQDMERANLIVTMLGDAGMRIFQDVRHIHPGESIIGRLCEAMRRIPRAIVLVTENYVASKWARRELSALLTRHRSGGLLLLPVLLDEIPLPVEIADIFTVDLRGFRAGADRAWAEPRVRALVEACQRGT